MNEKMCKWVPPEMDNMKVRVSVTMPWAPGQMYCEEIVVDARLCRESFAPLPRDRELPFCLKSMQQASDQMDKRHKLAERIAADLAEIILRAAQSRDPQHGYSPEEWAEMNKRKGSG